MLSKIINRVEATGVAKNRELHCGYALLIIEIAILKKNYFHL
jgi:hypothetical protein